MTAPVHRLSDDSDVFPELAGYEPEVQRAALRIYRDSQRHHARQPRYNRQPLSIWDCVDIATESTDLSHIYVPEPDRPLPDWIGESVQRPTEPARPSRRVFTDAYKAEAVRLADDLGNVNQAARNLGIDDGLIRQWRKKLVTQTAAEPSTPALTLPAVDLSQAHLMAQIERYRHENVTLRKALALFVCA
jgi:transposase-like protein